MGKVIISGASDDLVHALGDVEGADEFGASYNEADYIAVSDGTVVKVEYNNEGQWVSEVIQKGTGTTSYTPPPENEDDGYTSFLTLEGDDVTSVMFCGNDENAAKQMADIGNAEGLNRAKEVLDVFQHSHCGFENWWGDLDTGDRVAIMAVLTKRLK